MIISIFSCLQSESLVEVSQDKADINTSRNRFKDDATKSGVDDEKAT